MLWRKREPIGKMQKGIWPLVAMMALQAGATAYSASQRDDFEGIELPPYYLDPYYDKTQEDLYNMGSNILAGEPGDYYGLIGKQGGTEFEKLLADVTTGVTKRVEESAAKRGRGRGGDLSNVIASAVGKQETKLRWADLLKAIEGRKFLLGAGTGMLSGVRSSALTQSGMKNQYQLAEAGIKQQNLNMKRADEAAENQMWADIMSSALSAAGTYYGLSQLNAGGTSYSPGAADVNDFNGVIDGKDFSGTDFYNKYRNISFLH